MNLQYKVELTEGPDKNIVQYVWASDKQIKDSFDDYEKHYSEGNSGILSYESGLLKLIAKNEEDANMWANTLGLSMPFIKINDKYILNSLGDFG